MGNIPRLSLPVFPDAGIAGEGPRLRHAPACQIEIAGQGEIWQIRFRGVQHRAEAPAANPLRKGTDHTGKEGRIPRKTGGFHTADRPQRRKIQRVKDTKKVIRLRQSLRYRAGIQIVTDCHTDPCPTGGGGIFRPPRRNAIPPGGCGQYRKADAVRAECGKVYRFIPAKKNASHTGMP